MSQLTRQLEAMLFSSGRKMEIVELAEKINSTKGKVKRALEELREEIKQKESSLILFNEGDLWKLTVREEHMPLVRSIVAETELAKAVLETLAVIAWKAPILQSDIIKIRNNKAYDHISELVDSEFISRERYGRSYKIRLTQKFGEYFDVDDIKRLRKKLESELPELVDVNEEDSKLTEHVEQSEVQSLKSEEEGSSDQSSGPIAQNPEESKQVTADSELQTPDSPEISDGEGDLPKD